MTEKELLYCLSLKFTKGIGDILAKKIYKKFDGSFTKAFENIKEINNVEGISKDKSKIIFNNESLSLAEKEIEKCEKEGIEILPFYSDKYPKLLLECLDCPIVLFQKGNIDYSKPMVSIVGTRNNTSYGEKFSEEFIQEISKYGPTIVSGLAYGTDIHAHRLALKNNLSNIAVLGHGLDMIYPPEHEKESNKMIQNEGGLITEYLSHIRPTKENFPKRNRIIAGLSMVTIIMESPLKGGTMGTAKFANNYNREVFALPGRVTDPQSFGANWLIKNHQAHILTSPKDVIDVLGFNSSSKESKNNQKLINFPNREQLSEKQKMILEIIETNPQIHIDKLSKTSKVPAFKMSSELLALEMQGLIETLPGKNFRTTY